MKLLYKEGRARAVQGQRDKRLADDNLVVDALYKKGSALGIYPLLVQRGYEDGQCSNPFEILRRGERNTLWYWFNIWDEDTVFSKDKKKDKRIYQILKPYLASIQCPDKGLREMSMCGADCSNHEAARWMVDRIIHTVPRSETIYDFAPYVDERGYLMLNYEPKRFYKFFEKLYETYACILSDALQGAVYDGVTIFTRDGGINQEIHRALYFMSDEVPSGYVPAQPAYI